MTKHYHIPDVERARDPQDVPEPLIPAAKCGEGAVMLDVPAHRDRWTWVCECGFSGPSRTSREDARADGDGHRSGNR